MSIDLNATKANFTKALDGGTKVRKSAIKMIDKIGYLFIKYISDEYNSFY